MTCAEPNTTLQAPPPVSPSSVDPRLIKEMFGRGLSTYEIARDLKIGEAYVDAALHSDDRQKNPFGTVVRKPARQIMAEVAMAYGIRVDDITGPSRCQPIVLARCEAIRKVSAEWPLLSYPSLGRIFGGRDHTTIKHHLDKAGLGRTECACQKFRDRHPEDAFKRAWRGLANGADQ